MNVGCKEECLYVLRYLFRQEMVSVVPLRHSSSPISLLKEYKQIKRLLIICRHPLRDIKLLIFTFNVSLFNKRNK